MSQHLCLSVSHLRPFSFFVFFNVSFWVCLFPFPVFFTNLNTDQMIIIFLLFLFYFTFLHLFVFLCLLSFCFVHTLSIFFLSHLTKRQAHTHTNINIKIGIDQANQSLCSRHDHYGPGMSDGTNIMHVYETKRVWTQHKRWSVTSTKSSTIGQSSHRRTKVFSFPV